MERANENDLKVGSVYWVAGMGPMKLKSLPNTPRKITITMTAAAGHDHWVSARELFILTSEVMDYWLSQFQGKVKFTSDEMRRINAWREELKTQG